MGFGKWLKFIVKVFTLGRQEGLWEEQHGKKMKGTEVYWRGRSS